MGETSLADAPGQDSRIPAQPHVADRPVRGPTIGVRYREPMQRVERTATLPAPPDEVFAYLSRLDRLPEWQAGIVDARRTSDGPPAVGATATVTRELMGDRVVAPLTITAYDPPQRLEIGTEVSGVRVAASLDLAPADGGSATDVSFAMEIRATGFSRFMEPMIAGAAGGDIEASLARLVARFATGSDG
jgi:uncharacterized protein YndB with AHSA1/START domain